MSVYTRPYRLQEGIHGCFHLLLKKISLVSYLSNLRLSRRYRCHLLFNRATARYLFEMDMRACRSAGIPRKSYHRTGFHQITLTYSDSGVMPVQCAISVGVFHNHRFTITAARAGGNNSTFAGSPYRSADRDGNVYPPVEAKLSASERIYPPPDSGSDNAVLYGQIDVRLSCRRQSQEDYYGEEEAGLHISFPAPAQAARRHGSG